MIRYRIFMMAIFFLTAMPVFAQVRCEAVFGNSPEDMGAYGLNAKSMEPYYLAMFRMSHKAQGLNTRAGIVTQDFLRAESLEYGTLITTFRPRKNLLTDDTRFLTQVEENIEFVLESYSDRRDWSPELRQHLKSEAEHYAEQSTYIEVRKLNQENYLPESLIATMKIVKVSRDTPVKKLPMEADFSVTMPSNAGRKFEPANFVVAKDRNKIGTSEIFTQLILHARDQLQDPHHEAGKMMYYTPADSLGVKMYGRLGFIAVPGFEAPLKEGSKDWWMIGSTAENLATLPERLEKMRAQWSPEDILWMSELVSRFEGLQGNKTESTGVRTRDVTIVKGNSQKEVGIFITEPYTYKDENYRRLSITTMDGGIDIQTRIPDYQFPLKNGWRYQRGVELMLYQDGIFKLISPFSETSVTIKTDGAFKNPEYIHVQERSRKLKGSF